MEAISPLEFVVPSMRIAVSNRLLPDESFVYRVEQIRQLEEERYTSFVMMRELQLRRKKALDPVCGLKCFKKVT